MNYQVFRYGFAWATVEANAVSDDEGYFELLLLVRRQPVRWVRGRAVRSHSRRTTGESPPACSTAMQVRVAGAEAAFGVISDIDDTILHTGAQRAIDMVRQTLTGSELTRIPFVGAPELYRALARRGHAPRQQSVLLCLVQPLEPARLP